MTRALVTQLLEALEKLSDTEQTYAALDKADAVIKAAREYLATEPAGKRASLLRRANTSVAALDSRIMEPFYCALDQDASRVLSNCIDMLEADALELTRLRDLARDASNAATELQKQVLVLKAQQAKRVPMTDGEISEIVNRYYRLMGPAEFARAIEAHHGITPAEKPTVDEPEDLYALALKADNWGQP